MDKKIYVLLSIYLSITIYCLQHLLIVLKNGNNGDLAFNETFFMSFTQPTNVCIANRNAWHKKYLLI